ncbi:MAG: hypothetical protein OXH15_08000 [Gammaproteobacteria bacterium]|nr:hypothetical protein [Gammaproteobacteria bacterium]
MPERVYCSDLCLASGEPLLGTAGQVDVWLMLEYKPVWRAKATDDNDLAAPMKAWLERTVAAYAAKGQTARPQFIRRPELDTSDVSLFVGIDGELRRFQGDYTAIATLDLPNRHEALERVDEPHYFVCTNGQRDLCCARYGLPVYARLRELAGRRVWQTTHVGGHRFAPNVLALPQGALYGRVFADGVDAFFATVESGDLALPHLRGRAALPPAAQVAETLIDGARALRGIDGDRVTFETDAGARSVCVRESDSPFEVIASCGKTETETVVPWVAASQ